MVVNPPDDTVITRHPLAIALVPVRAVLVTIAIVRADHVAYYALMFKAHSVEE
jgi:hypothetical protein